MLRMFEQQLRGATPAGAARLWAEAVFDALGHGTAERVRPWLAHRSAPSFGGSAGGGRGCTQSSRISTYALRLLVRQPGVTVIAILTLALGIGANTAIFSAVNAILLRPLPYADPDRLVMVFEKRLAEGVLDNVVSPADFLDWSKMNGAFDGIAAMTSVNADLTGAGEPIRLAAGAVSPAFFDVLGVQPALGRTFRTEEAIVGQHRVVILSHDLWQRRFGSDAAIVGRKILLNGIPHEVVGVLPSTFEFPNTELTLWARSRSKADRRRRRASITF